MRPIVSLSKEPSDLVSLVGVIFWKAVGPNQRNLVTGFLMDRLQAILADKGQTDYLKCSRPNCDAHGCMKMQSGLHEAPKTALSLALM